MPNIAKNIAGTPYFEAHFDKRGKRLNAESIPSNTTDIYLICHGWNNSHAEARLLYKDLFTNFNAVAPAALLAGRVPAILGILWPSKKFDELVALESDAGAARGGVGLGETGSDPKSEKALSNKLTSMKGFFRETKKRKTIDEIKALIPILETQPDARSAFVTKVRSLLNRQSATKEDASDAFFRVEPEEIMAQLKIAEEDITIPVVADGANALPVADNSPPTSGAAAGIGDFFQGFKAAAMNVLNYATYYEMKERAGAVGKNGVAPLIDSFSAQVQRIHLIGHSFGGRVVTAAAADSTTEIIRSLTLLQAAFSHNGFSQSMNGLFRSVFDKNRIRGPILVTFTKNDKAVGVAYAIASRLAGQVAAALGDENDKFGGIGRNGAQKMNAGEAIAGDLVSPGSTYPFQAGKFFNAESSKFIQNHSDVTGKEVAYAIAIASLGQQ